MLEKNLAKTLSPFYIDVSPKRSHSRNAILKMAPSAILPLSKMNLKSDEIRGYLFAQAVADKQVQSHVVHFAHHWFITALNCELLALTICRMISIRQTVSLSVGLNLASIFLDRWNARRTTLCANRLALTYLNTATGTINHLRHKLCRNMAVKPGKFRRILDFIQKFL